MIQHGGDWRRSPSGEVLFNAQSRGKAEVWAGPTNVIEAVQAEDLSLRKALAAAMLEIIEGRRIWWGYEFEILDEFFRFLRYFAPDVIRYPQFFDHYGNVARQTWLGALARPPQQPGCTSDLSSSPCVIRRR